MRDFDVGLLYDPAREAEVGLAAQWARAMRSGGSVRVRRNRPYRGTADGLTTTLRRRFGPRYLGIELELNQVHWDGGRWAEQIQNAVLGSIERLQATWNEPRQGSRA